MRRLLSEPLLHFLVLGGLIFVAWGYCNRDGAPANGRIVVTRGRIESLEASFTRLWQRPPSASELGGLIDDYVREEVLAREALALGLDRDDTVIRRRLRQKMEFLSADIVEQGPPTDEALRAWFAAHHEAFRIEARYSFRHVYLDPARHGDALAADAARCLAQLQAGGDASTLGDPCLLEHAFEDVSASDVAAQFGADFAAAVDGLATGRWQGPIGSGLGAHLVLVTESVPGRLPPLEEVRDAVVREWADAQRQQTNERFYEALRQRYTVTIEQLDAAANAPPVTRAGT